MISCDGCSMTNSGFARTMLSSFNTNDTGFGAAQNFTVFGGVNGRTWLIDSNVGSMHASSGVFNNAVPDYAEFFENLTVGEIDMGLLISIQEGKVRPAKSGDRVIGIVSGSPGVVLGAAGFDWQGRYLKDEWNRVIRSMQKQPGWKPDAEKGETEADWPEMLLPVENPAYNPKQTYVSREDRPAEWTKVGMMGQLPVRVDKTVDKPDLYIKSDDNGMGTVGINSTDIKVMKILQPFDTTKGYGIALCLIGK